MNLSVFCSDKFYMGAKIMLTTFLLHNNFEKHNIFIISTDLEQKKVNKLNKFLKKRFDQEVTLVKISGNMKEGFPEKGHFSTAGFHKLYVFNFLPIKIDRIMCLDADAIVLNSLKDFYYQDMGECCLSACEDIHIKVDKEHFEELNYSLEDDYFNLGSIVIDLNKYLSAYSREDYRKWIDENQDKAKYVAQDVINIMFKNRIKKADYRLYNNQRFYYEELSEDELNELEEYCAVVHCIGKIKPWDFRYDMILSKYIYDVMKNNGMKMTYYGIVMKKKLFKLKYAILDRKKGGA